MLPRSWINDWGFWGVVGCVAGAAGALAVIIATIPREADLDRMTAEAQGRRIAQCLERWAPRDTKVVGLTCVVRLKDGWVPEDAIKIVGGQ
jgi:hypothetical protein